MTPLQVGDVATADDVVGIYASGIAEDNRTRYTLYDLRDDRTGYQSVTPGETSEAVIYVVG